MPTSSPSSHANATCCDCSKDCLTASADRPLSNSSRPNVAFALLQSTRSTPLSTSTPSHFSTGNYLAQRGRRHAQIGKVAGAQLVRGLGRTVWSDWSRGGDGGLEV